MRLPFRYLLAATLLLGFSARSQEIRPLGGDPGRTEAPAASPAQTARRLAAQPLALPFFDDFVTPRDGLPNPANWQDKSQSYPPGDGTFVGHYQGGGAYVSNRLAVNPPTRGTATLDGLRANGLPYNPGNASTYSATDTLTSQLIDLSGLSAGSNVYLSYAWQAGSVQGAASGGGSTQSRLILEFLDNQGVWTSIWTFNSANVRTSFKQQIFPIAQAAYLHAGFRFRFRAIGNQNLSLDAFGLDYIYLNRNRSAADTVFSDVAVSRGLGNPLRRFTALPAWQYAAAATSELSPTLSATANRLTAPSTPANPINPLPINWQGVVRELSSGGFGPATWLSGGQPLTAGARQVAISGDATTAPLPTSGTARRYRYQLQLQTGETNPLTLANDSTSRDVELTDYYAFDDGTAEASFNIIANSTSGTRYFAYALDLNKDDAVKSVLLAPIFNNVTTSQGENFQNRTVTVAVWADDNGKPAAQPLATKVGTLQNPLFPGNVGKPITTYQEIKFDQPVLVKGRCYIGYGQAPSGQFLGYGYDLNNIAPTTVQFSQASGVWSAFVLPQPGAPMVRAVMTNRVLATQAALAVSAQFSLYPNPVAPGAAVAVAGPAFRQAALLDALGRTVWQQPAAEAGQPTLRLPAPLPAGLYLVRLTLPDGSIATRRLTVQ